MGQRNLFGLPAKTVCFESSKHKIWFWEGRKDVRHKHYNKPKESFVSLGLTLQRDFLLNEARILDFTKFGFFPTSPRGCW